MSVACKINSGNCDIKKPYDLITNHTHFTLNGSGTSINLAENGNEKGIIATFINYNTIDTYITFNKGAIKNLINYGAMQGISVSYNAHSNQMVTIQNFGTINPLEGKYHFKSVNLTIQNYAMKITEDSAKFNAFSGTNPIDNSHLVLQNGSVKFAENGKLILDFGGDFEFGSGYLFEKLVVDISGANKLPVDISRLTAKDDIFEIAQSGNTFFVTPKPQNTLISATFRANLRTMNNFSMMTSAIIFPRKFAKSQNLTRTPQNSQTPQKRTIRRIKKVSSLQSAESNAQFPSLQESALADSWQSTNANEYANLKQNETFFYKNAESTAKNRRISRNLRTSNAVRDSASSLSLRDSASAESWQSTKNPADSAKNYHFIFTPFINHNSFAKAGNYALSGFDYGFITAFSVTLAESHTLGAHFALTYGTLRDKHDKDLAVKNLNLFGGLHYKIDLPYALFLKARGDFYHFSNDLKTQFLADLKPQNL
ncbi:hypothetical protein ACWIUD_07470, partial [Helicobacter sp. 23-1044]